METGEASLFRPFPGPRVGTFSPRLPRRPSAFSGQREGESGSLRKDELRHRLRIPVRPRSDTEPDTRLTWRPAAPQQRPPPLIGHCSLSIRLRCSLRRSAALPQTLFREKCMCRIGSQPCDLGPCLVKRRMRNCQPAILLVVR